MTALIADQGGISCLTPFQLCINSNGTRTYSSPWDSNTYESYNQTVTSGNVVLIDYYSDGTTLPKSGTQSFCFFRAKYENILGKSEIGTPSATPQLQSRSRRVYQMRPNVVVTYTCFIVSC